ncbi:MAG: shikimate dehydrogenase [Candidatus Binatia bacterium]
MTTITGRTRLLGLIADPLVEARSPSLANAALARRGRASEFVLLPLQVAAGDLATVVTGLRRVGTFAGTIVSMPHKETIVPLLDELTPEARLVGAVNAVRRDADGRLAGTTLDGEGFVAGLAAAGHDVAGKRVLLCGAGGAGAAIAFALVKHGCASLAIENRTRLRAELLATRIADVFPYAEVTIGHRPGAAYDVAVNATSLGMHDGDPLPLTEAMIDAAALVAECVVTRDVTPLLAAARARDRAIHGGLAMLDAQIELLLDFMGVGPGPSAFA